MKGEKILFRCVENPMTENSFIPNAVLLKPKFNDNCLAWGLSLFSNYDSAKQMLNNLSKNKQMNYSNIAKSNLTDLDGIKHTSKNKNHFTFYPEKNTDILSKFALVNEK
ncbi:hypothetical protein [Flavobacterium fryxellicola]|uniref:hypothetical protein n=1 Tax=Flavobacterium fryxellicola TaxID=249352 RepID=UPI001114E5A6|nr:hypothetical protein [Flavobacterium fryxellicola]